MKTRANKKRFHKRTQKAGVRIMDKLSGKEAFKYFIENSTFSFYRRGYFGILVLAKLNEGIKSPYRSIRTNTIGPVKYLLLKFFEIKPSTKDEINTTPDDIQREIDIQTSIYLSSISNKNTLLEPICPCIVYSHSEKIGQNLKTSFYNIISKSTKHKQIDQVFSGDLSFFAMEFMEKHEPLSSYEENWYYDYYKKLGFYMLDKLHELGFMLNDYHEGNVLINEQYNYFDFRSGRCIIIDFGRTNQIEYKKEFTNEYRIKLLKEEDIRTSDDLLFMFRFLDESHKKIQDKYIEIVERHFGNVYERINSYRFYKGGAMIPNSRFSPVLHKKIFTEENKKNAFIYEEQLKKNNPEKYNELMNGINEVLEEEKKHSGYINKLFSSQLTNLVDPAFTQYHNENEKSSVQHNSYPETTGLKLVFDD